MRNKKSAAEHLIQEVIKHGLLESIGDSVSIQSPDFRVLYQNEAQRNLMGDQIGKYCYEVYEKKESVCEGCPMAECFTDGKAHTAMRAAPVGGKILYFEITASPVRNQSGQIVAGIEIIRNVTDRKLAEDELKESEKSLRFVNRALTALSDCNEAVFRSDHETELLNSICRIVVEHGGYSFAWIGYTGQNIKKSILPVAQWGFEEGYHITWPDTERGRGPIGTAIRTGKTVVTQDIQNDPLFAPWRADAARHGFASSAAIPLIVDNQPLGALNIYARELNAFNKEEIKLLSQLADNLSFGIKTLRVRASKNLADSERRTRYIISVGRDITEQKKLEEQLLHSQKMESIGTLAGGVAHDFNNILTAIIGFTAILKRRIPARDPLQTYVERIQSSANTAANLTRGLLTFSRKQKGHPVSANINDLVMAQQKLLLRIIGEDIEFKTSLSDSSLFIKADPNQMEQVLMNLIANARDAMPEGGQLTIRTDSISIDETFTRLHGFGTPGEYALISISDSGTGIDSKTRERIFEPFFTTKGVNKGTGLGLSIVYGIIKQHNGYINVYSEPGQGTTFRIYLPLIRPAENNTEENREHDFVALHGTETILVAEDDEAVRDLLISVLTEFGYEVIAAGDGEEAVTLFMENRDSIRLVVTDIIMPRKNGRAVYEEIKKVRPDVKTVFLSGYAEEIISREDLFEPGSMLISKPVNPNVFLTKIREMLDST